MDFSNQEKFPGKKIWMKVFELSGDRILTYDRLILALDDTVYGSFSSAKKISAELQRPLRIGSWTTPS